MIPKFRVAFKNNILGEVWSIDFVDETIIIPVYDKVDGEYLGDNVCGLNQVTLMQSTGLFDVNGKEIFEGDVVRFGHLYEGFTNRVAWDKTNAAFKLVPLDQTWSTTYFSNFDHESVNSLEVIGNVYELDKLWLEEVNK